MPIQEFQGWKCIYCDTENDYTDWRCHNCTKKKPKPATVKRILNKRKKEALAKKDAERKDTIAKIDGLPEIPDTELTFDTSKLVL